LRILQEGLLEAYRRAYDGFSLDRVVADPDLNRKLADACREIGLAGEPRTWNWTLFGMRKAGLLTGMPTVRRTEIGWDDCESYLFASEIAWRQMIDDGCESLDSILCDPFLAASFDEIASQWAPGHTPLEYRWAAMKLRKTAKVVRVRASLLTDARLRREVALDRRGMAQLPDQPGIYVVSGAADGKHLYAGEAANLRRRLCNQFGPATRPLWKRCAESLTARYFPTACACTDRLAYQRRLVARHRPMFNLPEAL
jgi:site-specific DNA-methyltransferase (adenine-specific)